MLIGERLRGLREHRGMTQGDIEEAIGLQRTHISRVEQGHTVPSLETLVRFAAALEVPLYQLFYDPQDVTATRRLTLRQCLEELAQEGGRSGSEASYLLNLSGATRQMASDDRALLLDLADKLVKGNHSV